MNPLLEVRQYGQSIWLDNLTRGLVLDGTLKKRIEEDGLAGITTNPSIFHKAILDSPHYRAPLERLRSSGLSPEQRYETLAITDIQAACDLLHSTYVNSGGEEGYVSLEVSPHLAHDEAGTLKAADRLVAAVDRENLLIKVPATPAGVSALEGLIATGHKINVTLIFSLAQYRAVADAYLRGLAKWLESGGTPLRVKSVASLFLSRTDASVDRRLETLGTDESLALRGRAAVSLAKAAYRLYREKFHGPAFGALSAAGGRRQHLLWASTRTKNPDYSDLLYVEPLIGPETINTMPDATLAAFRDHGRAASTLETGVDGALAHLARLRDLGIDLETLGEELQREGVESFAKSFDGLLALVG